MANKVQKESLTKDALTSKLIDLKKEQMNLRFQKSAGQLQQTHLVKKTRREVARVATEISAIKKNAGNK